MGELVNLEAFRGAKPASVFAKDDPNQERLSDGIGSGYAVISYKGKDWFLKYKGETYPFIRPDDRSPLQALELVILDAAPHKSKSYYLAYNEDNEGSRPLCASMDGIKPDAGVQAPQAQACSLCPKNEFRVAANGRKGKDCSDYKRLAVLLAPELTTAILGQPLLEPVFMRVPAASLQSLAKMGDDMVHQGWAYHTYFARAEFERQESYPKIRFTALRPVLEADGAFVDQMRQDPQTKRITRGDGFGMRQIAAPVAPVTAPVTFTPPADAPMTMDELRTRNALKAATVAAPIEPVTAPVQPATSTVAQHMSFSAAAAAKPLEGEIIPPTNQAAPATPPQAAPVVDAVANDLGPATESDADLDAKINSTLAGLGIAPKK